MKKISFLFILLGILAGCAHNTPNSNLNTPITLPIETIKSNGSVIHQPFSKDKIDDTVGIITKTLNLVSERSNIPYKVTSRQVAKALGGINV